MQNNNKSYRIVIIEPSMIISTGLKKLIETRNELEVVAVVADCFHCLERIGDDGGVNRVMLYNDSAALPVDLIPLNYYVSRPGSNFIKILNVNLRLEDGGVWIKGKVFSMHTATEHIDRNLEGLDDLRNVLERYFGIPGSAPPLRDLSDQPGL